MPRSVEYTLVDWTSGWFQFRLRPDPATTVFDMSYYCQAANTTGEPPVPISGADFPANFSVTDRRTLNNILQKLTEEISKVVLNATVVYRDGHTYSEQAPPPP